jgi:hypothetical protein
MGEDRPASAEDFAERLKRIAGVAKDANGAGDGHAPPRPASCADDVARIPGLHAVLVPVRPSARPPSGFAGTDCHGRMDQPKISLAGKA